MVSRKLAVIFLGIITLVILIALFLVIGSDPQLNKPPEKITFGVIADCQYCNVEGTGVRKYSRSTTKLRESVAHLNTMDLDFTIHLGDFIDRDWQSFDSVSPIYDQLKHPHYFALGNHDFEVHDTLKARVPEKLGLSSGYYDFILGNWRFVVLDGNDISFHAYPEGSTEYEAAEAYYRDHEITSPKWNGALGNDQMQWLQTILDTATENKERVILFAHFPVYPENVHNLWNAEEVVQLAERYECVKAYINGHNHEGNYGQQNGVHYLTLKGMVDTEETSYGVIELGTDSLWIKGYGREESRSLHLKN